MLDVQEVRKDFPILATEVHGHPLVYLDNAATMQVSSRVLDRVRGYYETTNANVHRGMHYLTNASTEAFEEARKTIARFVGAPDSNGVVFTRGTTDALNMCAAGLAHLVRPGDRIVVTMMEHHSNFVPWQQLCMAREAEFCVVGLDENGDVDMAEYEAVLQGAPCKHGYVPPSAALGEKPGPVRIVAMTGCSNILGAVPPVRRAAAMAHEAGALFVLDGAQIMRHGQVKLDDLGCDFMATSGHKFGTGTGIGVLAGSMRAMELLRPRDFGGEMVSEVLPSGSSFEELPLRLEAGTPNYVGAVAMAAACDYLSGVGCEDVAAYEENLVGHALSVLGGIKGLHVLGSPNRRVGLVSFNIDGVESRALCAEVDKCGVALRSGHNCAQPLLDWYGLDSVARMSVAFYNTIEEIDTAAAAIERATAALKRE